MEKKLAYCHNSGNNDMIQTEIASNLSKLANNVAILSFEEAKTDIFLTITKDVSSYRIIHIVDTSFVT